MAEDSLSPNVASPHLGGILYDEARLPVSIAAGADGTGDACGRFAGQRWSIGQVHEISMNQAALANAKEGIS